MVKHVHQDEKSYAVDNLFPMNSTGIKTRKDQLLIDIDKNNLIKRFDDIRRISDQEAVSKYNIKASPHWDLAKAKPFMTENTAESVRPILFQPFDIRSIYYEKYMIERGDHRYDTMRHLLQPNIAFISVKKSRLTGIPQDFFCSDILVNVHATSSKDLNYVFPLYLYPSEEKNGRDENVPGRGPGGRRANLNSRFIYDLTDILGLSWCLDGRGDLLHTIGPEDVFNYMYAFFHSWSYREHHADTLKNEPPHVPLIHDLDMFRSLVSYGAELVDLHTMRVPGKHPDQAVAGQGGAAILMKPAIQFVGGSVNIIEDPSYDPESMRVYISKNAYFDKIAPQVWAFRVGGYQVLERWIIARKGRLLSYNDILHYQRVATALTETARMMAAIDQLLPESLMTL